MLTYESCFKQVVLPTIYTLELITKSRDDRSNVGMALSRISDESRTVGV